MIRFEAASKSYVSLIRRRRVDALADFSMEMRRGEVVGIAGPNGAGKSTLISLMMGFLHPSSGSVTINGVSPRAWVAGEGVGYLTELVNLPPRWKVPHTLHRMAALSGVPSSQRGGAVQAMMTRLGLDEHAAKQVRQLSKGNLQRLGLGQALLGDFEIVVLDEPTHGLDPVWTQRFRDVVAELRRPDRLVVIASHNLDELELLADRVAILNHGRLQRIVEHGTASTGAELMAWRVTFEGSPDVAAVLPGATEVAGRAGTWRITASRTGLSAGLGVLLSAGAILIECSPEESRLETEFRAAVGS
ncbi:MAG: ABC transporter ATP-binding protein [Gemmatimonadales bacterium]